MRQNLPVTGREHELPPDHMLVSVTDLKGRITYCNPDFEAASGYSAAELLGQPHNLLRHPDMPQEAFRDMWETIQSGLPWTALVKNRCKSGDHYWVRANATPMKAGDRIVGYLSVRTPVTQRDEIAQADALYRRMREQEQRGKPLAMVLHRGRVLPGARWRRWLHRAAARARAFGAAGSAQVGAVALTGMLARATSPAVWLPASLALGLGATAWSRARDQRRLARVTGDALRLAAGDLAHVPSTGLSGAAGEMQVALAQLAVNLRAAIGDVRREVRAAVDSVTEVATGGQDLSRRTESLAASLEQTAAAMDQINGTVQQSAESAVQGARMATQSAQVAERSHQAVLGTARAMQAISESSRRIGDITHLIESVAFQTNILALNAAVEAARAGEAGRGFAVVATEVRTLAHRTTEAAREIKQLIAQAGARVEDGVHQTETAQARMMEVLEAVRAVGAMLADLETVAGEQRSGIGQIDEAVNHMDGITQQNAAMVEELAAASGALDQQMHAVSDTMRLFRLHPGEHSLAEADAVALRRQSRAAAPVTPARHAERSPERLAA